MYAIFAILIITRLVGANNVDEQTTKDVNKIYSFLQYCSKYMDGQLCVKKTTEFLKLYFFNKQQNVTAHFDGTITFQDIIISGLTNFSINKILPLIDERQIKFDVNFLQISTNVYHKIIRKLLQIDNAKLKGDEINREPLNITIHVTLDDVYNKNNNSLISNYLENFKEYNDLLKLDKEHNRN